jgi:uncharacterized OB-fold protein
VRARTQIGWRRTGTVYSYTVTRRASDEYADATSYVLVYVELEEGSRILTNIIDCDVDRVEVDSTVDVVFDDTGSDRALPRFTLREEN